MRSLFFFIIPEQRAAAEPGILSNRPCSWIPGGARQAILE